MTSFLASSLVGLPKDVYLHNGFHLSSEGDVLNSFLTAAGKCRSHSMASLVAVSVTCK